MKKLMIILISATVLSSCGHYRKACHSDSHVAHEKCASCKDATSKSEAKHDCAGCKTEKK